MTDWSTYIAGFHARHPGITEDVLSRARSGDLTPYRWLARAVSGARVLDLACGNSALAATLTAAGAGRPTPPWVVGIDLSRPELLDGRARGRAGPLVQGDAARLPFRDGSFDAVTSSAGLMVTGQVPTVLGEAARVLRVGGVLAATVASAVPLRPHDMRILAPLTARLRTTPQFPAGAELTGLAGSLQTAGFRVLEDARERFAFVVRTGADARLLLRSLYLPDTSDQRRESAAAWLTERAEAAESGVEVAIPVRRVVAQRQ
ncbi:MAG: methyltransferase domain-containing protein [Actinomycetota bacterium]|nr:methyltransferase domain-containing protein [Actinomycetota bacterium]